VTNIFGSSLGKKYVMAVSGGVLFCLFLDICWGICRFSSDPRRSIVRPVSAFEP